MNHLKIDVNNVWHQGDIHGKLETFFFNLVRLENFGLNAAVFALGDNGLGFKSLDYYKRLFDRADDQLAMRNLHAVFFRGNHDNPEFYRSDLFDEYSNIHVIDDYTVVEIKDMKILCIGGAISIDRTDRVLGKSYWKDEQVPELDQFDKIDLECGDIITHVCTHDAPLESWPENKKDFGDLVETWSLSDINLKRDICESRNRLSQVFAILSKRNAKLEWHYGHYHENRHTKVHDADLYCHAAL